MKAFWAKIIGGQPFFSLEAQIFNAISLISSLGLVAGITNNLLIGNHQIAGVMAPVFICVALSYYFARFKRLLNPCIAAYLIATNVLIVINFRLNSGINGPALLLFLLSYFLTISIVPKKQYWLWITLNIAIVVSLLAVQYLYPELIINSYKVDKSRFADFGFVYVLIAAIIFMVTTTIRNSYHAGRNLIEQKASELEIANDTKNKLFSILAHDLRSPLASIQNYLEILSDFKLDEAETESIKKDLLSSTQKTQQMLSNLLSWSKSQMKGVSANLVPVNLKEALLSTFQIHQTIAAEKGIHLNDRLKSNVRVMADIDMLQLIVRNLINNAIKFTPPGGEIIVSDDVVANSCRISIKDNGTGMSADQQKTLFTLKTNSTTGTKNEKGVGLGLVLCKEFAELQGGKITFESAPGLGTVFYVSFRLLKEENIAKLTGSLVY